MKFAYSKTEVEKDKTYAGYIDFDGRRFNFTLACFIPVKEIFAGIADPMRESTEAWLMSNCTIIITAESGKPVNVPPGDYENLLSLIVNGIQVGEGLTELSQFWVPDFVFDEA